MKFAYKINNFSYKYPLSEKYVLQNIYLQIQKRKIYGIIGPNNAGKTTLCLALKGYIPHFYRGEFHGEIFLQNSVNLLEKNQTNHIGIVFNDPFSQLTKIKKTVFEEIAFGLENIGEPIEQIQKKVKRILQMFHLENHALENPMELSGGQIQRVTIASIMVLEPEILILDEPTTQLDSKEAKNIYKILEEYKNQGNTAIIVDPNIDLLSEYADRIIAMENGKIIKEGHCSEVLYDSAIEMANIEIPTTVSLIKKLQKKGFYLSTDIIKQKDWINYFKER